MLFRSGLLCGQVNVEHMAFVSTVAVRQIAEFLLGRRLAEGGAAQQQEQNGQPHETLRRWDRELLEQVLACGQVTAGSLYRSYFVSVQMIVSNVTFRGRRLPWGESAD